MNTKAWKLNPPQSGEPKTSSKAKGCGGELESEKKKKDEDWRQAPHMGQAWKQNEDQGVRHAWEVCHGQQ